MMNKISIAKKGILFSTIVAILALTAVLGIACGKSTSSQDGADGATDTEQQTASPQEVVLAWLNGWNHGDTYILLTHETESFLGYPSEMREQMYNEDFQENSYTINNIQLKLVSQDGTSAEVTATYFIKMTSKSNEVLLEQTNSWRFFLEKTGGAWLISSYE